MKQYIVIIDGEARTFSGGELVWAVSCFRRARSSGSEAALYAVDSAGARHNWTYAA